MHEVDLDAEAMARAFKESERPEAALVLNHGYTAPDGPAGGAPDTGGIQDYVRSLAGALERLGYRVTVFTRGGFPHFDGARLRREVEYAGAWLRFVYVPGGGDAFLRREELGGALDEQVAWLDRFTRAEAEARGVRPWDLFAFVNSHFWDGALLALGLIERWRDDVASEALTRLLAGVLPEEELERLRAERHRRALGRDWAHHLGLELLALEGSPATPVHSRARAGLSRFAAVRGLGPRDLDQLWSAVERALARKGRDLPPALQPLQAAGALGRALIERDPALMRWAEASLARVDRHVWTPHALAAPDEDGRRDPRLAERRSHERLAARGSRAFAVTSAALAGELRARHGVPTERMFYFPPCVDRARFRPRGPAETAAAYAYLADLSGLPVEEVASARIVFETSRMHPDKRKDLLLEAFARAVEEGDASARCLLFVGGGPEGELAGALRRQIASRAALRGRAFLTGFIPEEHLAPLYSLAAVYACPSESEDFGMTVLQAAASGTAVLASDRVPFPRQYAPEDAVILPAGDVDDWVQALRRLLADDQDRQARARRLVERVKVLDWEAQTRAFLGHLGERFGGPLGLRAPA
jgi:glycosyltransferase involved in cell wall biosynthesis